jgi:hypothetical protein
VRGVNIYCRCKYKDKLCLQVIRSVFFNNGAWCMVLGLVMLSLLDSSVLDKFVVSLGQ